MLLFLLDGYPLHLIILFETLESNDKVKQMDILFVKPREEYIISCGNLGYYMAIRG